MQIRYGIESKETREKCPSCQVKKSILEKDEETKTQQELKDEKKVCSCHCKYADISDVMLMNCNEAWHAASKSVEEKVSLDVNEDVGKKDPDRIKRLNKLKESMKRRSTLYKPEIMVKIYETQSEKRKSNLAQKVDDVKSKKSEKTKKKVTSDTSRMEKDKQSKDVRVMVTDDVSSSKKLVTAPTVGYKKLLAYKIPKRKHPNEMDDDEAGIGQKKKK